MKLSENASFGQMGGSGTPVVRFVEGNSRITHVLEGVKTPTELGPTIAIVQQDIPLDEEMHYVMRKLFSEYDASLVSNTSLHSSIGITLTHLPLISQQDPTRFISNLAKVIKIQKVHSTYITSVSSGGSSFFTTQLLGFILISQCKSTLVGKIAGSFTRYLEFSGQGNEDVEQHQYLCEEIWRARQTLNDTKLIESQTTLRERKLFWFIKWSTMHKNPTIYEAYQNFVQEFKLPQKNQQGLSELWNIKQHERVNYMGDDAVIQICYWKFNLCYRSQPQERLVY